MSSSATNKLPFVGRVNLIISYHVSPSRMEIQAQVAVQVRGALQGRSRFGHIPRLSLTPFSQSQTTKSEAMPSLQASSLLLVLAIGLGVVTWL